MDNHKLFTSATKYGSPADRLNSEMALAYKLEDRAALSQLVTTGCLNNTFYIGGGEQLDWILDCAQRVDSEFIAKAALYARTNGFMKDTPALLLAILATREKPWLEKAFDRVVDNGKMLRNFCRIIRSGKVGRKSFGTRVKRLICNRINAVSDYSLFSWSVGNDPSLADILKMVHPKPTTVSKEALFGYLLGKENLSQNLPSIVQAYEDFKKDTSLTPPNVPFQMIASLNLGDSVWKEIAKNAKWTMTRMNLNTFARHGVFNDEQLTQLIANRIRNRDEVLEARAFPYQLMVAYLHADENVPLEVQNAIQDAMEIATENVPVLEGNVYVFVDVSASMAGAVTGYRGSATTVVRCVDVASLFASALLRKNSNTTVWPFNGDVLPCNLNSRDSVITNANKLANLCTNGTNISAPLAKLNKLNKKADLVIYLSDNESWMDGPSCYRYNNATASSAEWTNLKRRCPNAKLVCINLTPAPHSQVKEQKDVYNIGGFSDEIFSLIYAISRNEMNTKHWIGEIERIVL